MDYKPDYYEEEIENPYGKGTLYATGKIARILPDGSLDFLQNGGRTVLTDGSNGRIYYDLAKVEKILCDYDGIDYAEAYLSYDPSINEMNLKADIKGPFEVDIEELNAFIEERGTKLLVPCEINYLGTFEGKVLELL